LKSARANRPYHENTGLVEWLKCLPSKCEALSSNPITAKRKKFTVCINQLSVTIMKHEAISFEREKINMADCYIALGL
jgi:hypothetical protein